MTEKPMLSEASKNPILALIDKQLSSTLSTMHSDSMRTPYNTDDIYQKNSEYSIYEDMMKDDQVSVALSIKKDLVLSSGWDIVGDDDNQNDMCDELAAMLYEDMVTPFDEALTEFLTAFEFGFSLTEKIFGTRSDGAVVMAMLKTRHPATWMIHTDEYGDIFKFEQFAKGGSIDVPAGNLIHFINSRKFQNPYGTSDLRAAYEAWFIKNQIKKYYAIFMEKAASPVPIGRYETGVPPTEIDALFTILKRFQSKTAMVIPKTMEVDFLESKSNGEVFQKAINIFNLFIGRALYVPDLFGYSGEQTGGGSFALGEHQINMYFRHINRRRIQLERLVNKEILRPLVIANYGFQEKYPIFKLRPAKEDDIFKTIAAWTSAIKSQIYTPAPEEIDHFRALINFPVVDLPPHIVPGMQDVGPDGESDGVDKGGSINENGKENKKGDEKKDETINGRLDNTASSETREFAKDPYRHEDGLFYKRVDFKSIESHLVSLDLLLKSAAMPIVTEMLTNYGSQIAAKKIVERGDLAKIDSLKLVGGKKLHKVMTTLMLQAYADAKTIASTELLSGNFASLPTDPDERFLAILAEELLHFIGDWEYLISKSARLEILRAIKDGIPISEVVSNITLTSKVGDAAMVSLERYSRTKFTEIMNKGRQSFFESTGMVAGYQFSAIMDARTSVICEGLHGKFFKAGTEVVPPLHFNCRSILIPITKFEQFDPSTKVGSVPIGKFVDDNIGNGFSKYSAALEKEVRPKITDAGVERTVAKHSDKKVITYSKDGLSFYESTIFDDGTVKHREIDA